MEPNVFQGYFERGITCSLDPFGMNNTPLIAQTKIIQPMAFIVQPNEGNASLLDFGKVMKYSSKFQKICYRTQCIFGIPCVGYCRCIGHEEYPFKSNVDLWCLITKYPNEGIGFLVDFSRATQYPVTYQNICYGAQCFYGIL